MHPSGLCYWPNSGAKGSAHIRCYDLLWVCQNRYIRLEEGDIVRVRVPILAWWLRSGTPGLLWTIARSYDRLAKPLSSWDLSREQTTWGCTRLSLSCCSPGQRLRLMYTKSSVSSLVQLSVRTERSA